MHTSDWKLCCVVLYKMKCQFVVMEAWLWIAVSRLSVAEDVIDTTSPPTIARIIQCKAMRNAIDVTYSIVRIDCNIISTVCDDHEGMLNCTASLPNFNNMTDCEMPTTPEESKTFKTDADNNIKTTTSNDYMKTSNDYTTTRSENNSCPRLAIVLILGVLVSLLVMLLAVVTTGWVWTCWILKKRRVNSESVRSTRNNVDRLTNPTYEGDDRLPLQPMPAYETIQPHHSDREKLELAEQGEHAYGYEIPIRGKNNKSGTTATVGLLETVHEESKEESYSKLELTGKSNLVHSSVGRGGRCQEYEYKKLSGEPDVPRDTTEEHEIPPLSSYLPAVTGTLRTEPDTSAGSDQLTAHVKTQVPEEDPILETEAERNPAYNCFTSKQ